MMSHSAAGTPLPGNMALLFTWTGAALFVASLGLFLYSYEITYGVSATGGVWGPALIDTALFTVFALHHSMLARPDVKRRVIRHVPAPLERSTFTWVASLLLLIVCAGWRPVAGLVYSLPSVWRLVGYAAQAAGLALTIQATAELDALDLAGVRPVLDARRGSAVPAHVPLNTKGLYSVVRHPLYFGWVLFVFGIPDMTGTRAVFALVSTLYLVLAVPFEERSLIRIFGADYSAYQRHTRWRIVPGIW
jgi:protein-S-isoprenylcysteine O-methyltransferase Ste14